MDSVGSEIWHEVSRTWLEHIAQYVKWLVTRIAAGPHNPDGRRLCKSTSTFVMGMMTGSAGSLGMEDDPPSSRWSMNTQ